MQFCELRLAEPILRAVADEGYTRATPVQQQAIPHVLAGRDLLGCAQTGTGKTAAFALPILHRLINAADQRHAGGRKHRDKRPRALILAPTRELACQIGDSFRTYGARLQLRSVTIFGGVNQNPQVRALNAGVDIVIATPGRLMDLVQQRHVDLRAIEVLVLDEADRMLDMGFIHDIRKVIGLLPANRQTLLFSATMPNEIRALAASILRDPASVQVDAVSSPVKMISQSVYHVPQNGKPALLRAMIAGEASGRTLVFTRTKHGADKVVKDLRKNGIRAEAIHGNKAQNARTRALAAFKSVTPPVLVATDIASRGIDVDEIAHVVNYDIPVDAETYVHRIGRTARAGATGAAISFCDPEERGKLRAIERLTGEKIALHPDQPQSAATNGAAPDRGTERRPKRNTNGKRKHAAGQAHSHDPGRRYSKRKKQSPTRGRPRATR